MSTPAEKANTTSTTHLGCKTLEQRGGTLVPDEIFEDGDTARLRLEIGVLDARLDSIERRSDSNTRNSADNGRDEVLSPGCLAVVFDAQHDVLCPCRRSEQLPRQSTSAPAR